MGNRLSTSQLFSGPLFPLFFGGCPTKMVLAPKKGSLFFSRVTEQLRHGGELDVFLESARPLGAWHAVSFSAADLNGLP